MNIGIVGCGNIAARYAERIAGTAGLELVAATDVLPALSDAFGAEHGCASHQDLAALLADDAVELVVNLTSPQAHAEVTRAALRAGKHVHSEKPLALRHSEAQELVELAARQGVRLGCAPATLLGEAQQTAWKLVREGAIGTVRVVYAEANWGRLEAWHPDPSALYAVGPLVDVGVYPLTIATAMFGPARRVVGYATTVEPDRVLLSGAPFRPEAPDLVVALCELESGVVVRVTASFYVGPSKQRGLELHGDSGSIALATWGEADSRLELKERAGEYEPVQPVRKAHHGIDWSRALVDLAEAVANDRPHRASGEHAAHVVELLDAVERSVAGGCPVAVTSSFPPPEPLDWAR